MPIVITPELGIPLPVDTTAEEVADFRSRARAWFKTVSVLQKAGMPVEVTEQDRVSARAAVVAGSAPANPTSGTVVQLEAILSEWDEEILDVGRRLRSYVTNKLIIESTDPDPQVRLKALAHLGKLSNVGLFSERVDISVTHRTLSDIETDLRRTLEMYGGNVVDVVPVKNAPALPASVEELDLDEELGRYGTPKDIVEDAKNNNNDDDGR